MNSKLVWGFLAFFVLIVAVGSSHAASVDVDNWTFTVGAVGWRASENFEIEGYDSRRLDPVNYECEVVGTWKGTVAHSAFVFPSYPNAPKDNKLYGYTSGTIDIYVLKMPVDLLADLQEHGIAVYGSADKIPNDRKKQDTYNILKAGTRNTKNVGDDWSHNYSPIVGEEGETYEKRSDECFLIDSEKDITFNNHQAHITEFNKYENWSVGTIAIQLDENTVGIIDVWTTKTNGEDSTGFNGRARDVINSFALSPK